MRVGNNRGDIGRSWSASLGENSKFRTEKSFSGDKGICRDFPGNRRRGRKQCGSDQRVGDLKEMLEKMLKMFERVLEKLVAQRGGEQGEKPPVEGDTKCPDTNETPECTCPPEEEPITPPECTCPPEEEKPPVSDEPVCEKPSVPDEPEVEAPAPSEDKPATPDITKQDFMGSIKEILNKTTGQKVHEERFQYGIATYLIGQKFGDEAASAFQEAFKANRKKGQANAGEDATKEALKQLVSDGILTEKQAEQINGLSFKAAQLDGKENQLYDGKGDTSAKAGINKAVNLAWEDLESLVNGDMADWPTRSLDAPSTKTKEVSSSSGVSSSAVPSGGGSQEFLWKPRSDHGNKLVIILPNRFKGMVSSVSVLGPNGREIEEGKSSGYANGNREHFRFNKDGGSYPNNAIVEITLTNGETVRYRVGDTSNRYSK